MLEYSEPIAKLIDEFKKLPGIGQKNAQRLVFFILRKSKEDVESLAKSLLEVKEKIKICSVCNNLTDIDPCFYCTSPDRDRSVICIVEEPYNLVAIEKTRSYKGLYHILHGALSPIRRIKPDDLKLSNLFPRLKPENNQMITVKEIIIATNPTTEGEATAHYIANLIKPLGIRVTRIATGMPVGSDLEFVDEVTMDKALANRHEI
ncbi:MAG: recombination mediator RecR [Pyrinomonadaceae bacterium]|nr:recombination mediator RecR [Pyrinomonadaceae bacterium]MCX7639631.1 recombination mediator RecR [Pyrinomonadaceae bacterium]MDW8303351.1 recombination mediator RecR [Acidobacteriota bacterium]